MRRVFLFLVLFLFSYTNIHADRYFRDGDIVDNRYYDTLGYGIGELLESKKCPTCVEYDTGAVYGSSTAYILSNTHIDDITDTDLVYGLKRLHNIYDEVSLPPYSSMDFIYWSKNMAGTDVNISSLKMFISRLYSYQGDLRNVLYIQGEYDTLPIKYIVWEYPRSGIVKTYEGLGIINDGGGVIYGMKLDSAYVKSPLVFVRWEAEELDDDILLRIYVKNESIELLKNVVYTHNGYTYTRNYEANEEYMYEYVTRKEDNGSLGYAGIYNPNSRTECVARGEHLESTYVGDSPVVGGIREEDGGYMAYIGSRVKPFGYRFCVTRIPYTLYSEEMFIGGVTNIEQEVVESDVAGESDVTGEVFGVKQLPKTGKISYSFLVVFPILWYYVLRRFLI